MARVRRRNSQWSLIIIILILLIIQVDCKVDQVAVDIVGPELLLQLVELVVELELHQ